MEPTEDTATVDATAGKENDDTKTGSPAADGAEMPDATVIYDVVDGTLDPGKQGDAAEKADPKEHKASAADGEGKALEGSKEATAHPAPVEPMATEPTAAEPMATEPAAAEPMATEPAATEPTAAEPMATEPTAAGPTLAEPMATEPTAADPTAAESSEAVAVASEPVATAAAIAADTALPTSVAAPSDPSAPGDRDVVVGDDSQKANLLLIDLISLHRLIWNVTGSEDPKTESDVADLASHLVTLIKDGKAFVLAGLKDVPKSFLQGSGRFIEKVDDKWTELSDDKAKEFVVKKLLETSVDAQGSTVREKLSSFPKHHVPKTPGLNGEIATAPEHYDVIFLRAGFSLETKPYDYQSGNKHFFNLASQYVTSEAAASLKRVEAAVSVITAPMQISTGSNEMITKQPRFVVQKSSTENDTWIEMDMLLVAELAVIFVFEVFLEKEVHTKSPVPTATAGSAQGTAHASLVPVEYPTAHDVLFGRGGMTNSHPGNRRFRDIIALHRPDYIRAIKVDKPNVARKIVRAIRLGTPPGRFLKKAEDGFWYDVGDRCAAEKTSQGLRERSNQEKRQRSAMREALKIRKEDFAGTDGTDSPEAKKLKTEDLSTNEAIEESARLAALAAGEGALSLPLSLSMKDKAAAAVTVAKRKAVKKPDSSPSDKESLPPNAVDAEGNILVTDHDILCGRGGLTNHHPGNKRFRDVVALHRPDYVRAPKIQKPSVARVIVRAIRNGDPPGRFLKKDPATGKWVDIGDKRAAEKTSQALREKSNEERDRLRAAAAAASGVTTAGLPQRLTAFLPPIAIPTAEAAAVTSPTPAQAADTVKAEEEVEEKSEEKAEEKKEGSLEATTTEAANGDAAPPATNGEQAVDANIKIDVSDVIPSAVEHV